MAGPAVGSVVPSSRVELRISCKKLRDADVFSHSDPLVAVYTKSKRGSDQEWVEVSVVRSYRGENSECVCVRGGETMYACVFYPSPSLPHQTPFLPLQYGRTEMIKNTINPEFAKVIEMDYRFEEVQKLKFSVFDIDNETDSLGDDDFLGSMECTLGEVRATSAEL